MLLHTKTATCRCPLQGQQKPDGACCISAAKQTSTLVRKQYMQLTGWQRCTGSCC